MITPKLNLPARGYPLVSRNIIKAAVWTHVSCNLARKANKSNKELAYFDGKLQHRLNKLKAENIPLEKFEREKSLLKRKSPQFF